MIFVEEGVIPEAGTVVKTCEVSVMGCRDLKVWCLHPL